ncbi:helix-turn-helix transcriptional regulator [Allokutzneria oryzae]|uniref:LuxR C-terminal-related transcriptional regulator n=1 Tax=Allokutzneria oryzae TaxID=1378989 RepID=A0ABV6A9F2_9PSEU
MRVLVRAGDPISLAGVAGQLGQWPAVDVVTADSDVALLVVDTVDSGTVALLRELGRPRVVLVANRVTDAQVLDAVEFGLRAVVPRAEATAERLVHAVLTAHRGGADLPPELLGELLTQLARLQREVLGPIGLTAAGVTVREAEVLRLTAEGLDTGEIAERMCFSEGTVKSVVHGLMRKFGLRNRVHVVAHAIRAGII